MVTKIEAGKIFIFLPYSLLKRAGAIRLKVNFCLFCLGAVSNVMHTEVSQWICCIALMAERKTKSEKRAGFDDEPAKGR